MSEGVPDCVAGSEGDPRSTEEPTPTPRRTLLPLAVVALLALDAVLLAWTEMAWLTLRTAADGVPLPLAAAVALVTVPVLVLAADTAWPASHAPFVPLAAWTLTILGAGLWSPAGAGVLPPDWRAVLLLAAGVLPGALALSWTSAKRRVLTRAPSDG
ncbi:hypothetical protein EV188_104181 [Actinomycetospora succinea]|uniref:Uncharacterized protein n=1 Tax=Actinomycetospora succinea TaxID=663603 RepID=A0A4R6VCZ5_9PSEU|nr:hypothetical protein [Actinomycetospora succinea]TDQ58441.1 hypothetical protein EV188_104181 [Actinomycetospora succinea]